MTSTETDAAIAVAGGLGVFRFAEKVAAEKRTDLRYALSACLGIDPTAADEFIDCARSFISVFGQVNAQKTNTLCDLSGIDFPTSDPTLRTEIIKTARAEPDAAHYIALSQILGIDSSLACDLIERTQVFTSVCKPIVTPTDEQYSDFVRFFLTNPNAELDLIEHRHIYVSLSKMIISTRAAAIKKEDEEQAIPILWRHYNERLQEPDLNPDVRVEIEKRIKILRKVKPDLEAIAEGHA
jgi:hypothetical protein